MKKVKVVSKITLSLALIGALGLAGCGSDSKSLDSSTKTDALSVNSNNTPVSSVLAKVEESKTATPTIQKQGYSVVVGKVSLDETPVAGKSRSLSKNQADIVAYNLSNSSVYRTTTDANGNYELSSLSDGEYQIFAENSRYAKKASQKVTLSKSVRKVVNFMLQATGSVSGKVVGANIVYIPGTDHLSIPDSDGNFALNGVPVGDYVLMYESDHFKGGKVDISVGAGKASTVEKKLEDNKHDTSEIAFGDIDTSLEYGVLGLHHEGIRFNIYGMDRYYTAESVAISKERRGMDYDKNNFDYLKKYITLKNDLGINIPFKIDDYAIKTKEIVSAGKYTLTFSKDISEILHNSIKNDRIYKFSVDNISVAIANMEHGVRVIDLILPKTLTDVQQGKLASLKVMEKGKDATLSIKQVWSDDRSVSLFGSFKTGVEYEIVTADDEQKEILGTMKMLDHVLQFGHVEVTNIYPSQGMENIDVNQNLFVNVQYADQIDPSTIKFTLNGNEKVYKEDAILFNGIYNNYDDKLSSSANISFKHEALAYGKEYILSFSAKDISGNEISSKTTFKTMKPSIVEMGPEGMDELFDHRQQIRFNVPVDKNSGTIVIENLTTSSASAKVEVDEEARYDSYSLYFSLSSLNPNERYKITASGFKDLDGIAIPQKEVEFSTPPKMLIVPKEYSQNMNVSARDFNHKVNLFFFGGLSDSEKSSLADNLKVKSYNKLLEVDASHPSRKLFFTPVDNGVLVSVAFTIEENSNYELLLVNATGLSNIVLPDNKKLVSFATTRLDSNDNNGHGIRMINRFHIGQPHLDQDPNGDTKLISNIDMDINIPLGYAPKYKEEDGSTYYEDCWSIYRNSIDEIRRTILDNSLHITSEGENILFDTQISDSWGIWTDYSNGERLCYIHGDRSSASFEVDYNKDYEISLDFNNNIQSEFPVSNKVLTKTLHTNPIGTVKFEIIDGIDSHMKYGGMDELDMMNSDMITLNMHSNAPMVTENMKDLLQLKVNGETFVPEFNFEKEESTDTTMNISFALPRTLYSILQVEVSKAPDQNLTFFNLFNNQKVVNNSVFDNPIIFTEDVKPDLIPVEIAEIRTNSAENNQVEIRFNRPVDLNDIVTIAEDGTISNISFEIKSNDSTDIAISNVDVEFDRVMFTLSSELNVSKVYTLSLKSGKSIKAAFGAQKLSQFSQEIPLTYINIGEMRYINRDATIRNTPSDSYELGRTDMVKANYNGFNTKVIVPLNMKDMVVVDSSKSHVDVHPNWNKNELINEGNLIYDQTRMVFVQPTRNYGDISIDAKVIYSINSKEYKIEFSRDNLNKIDLAYIDSYHGDSVDSIVFNINNMENNYAITSANFIVYNDVGEVFNSNINVQFNDQSKTSSPRVTFNNLEDGKVYRVDIVGIPHWNMQSSGDDVINDTLFISMPVIP